MAWMSVHPHAYAGFSSAAASYERGRPGYPPAAVSWLVGQLDLGPGRTVLDLGAGTGKLTRELVPTGASVLALEPVPEMAAVLQRSAPSAQVVTATAAATRLETHSVDAATAAQAFHWFSDEPSLREIHRVLVPGGPLGLIWNHRDTSARLWAAIEEVVEPHRHGEPTYRDRKWAAALAASDLFGDPLGRVFEHSQELALEQLVDRVASISFIAILDAETRQQVAEQVLALGRAALARSGGHLALVYRTEVWVTRAIP